MSDELLVEGTGPIRTLVLNRPDSLNAVNNELHMALGNVWRELLGDKEVRAVIITGAGRAFSAGGDLELLERTAGDPVWRYEMMGHARKIVTEMMAFPFPVIAAVNGPAVGLGCSLAVLSDIVLISEDAYFADPHVSVGLVAADGGALAWPAMTSLLKAKEYLFTGDRIPAALAVEMGLANRVVPADAVMSEAIALAERLLKQPQQALLDTKRALNMHLAKTVNTVIDFAIAAESETFGLPEFRERLASFPTRAKKG